ncbi:MAG: metallophosphoesterase [Planctomycetes bacterium]|nr:metallophosphoesterase [Planctomycetota bacterium]
MSFTLARGAALGALAVLLWARPAPPAGAADAPGGGAGGGARGGGGGGGGRAGPPWVFRTDVPAHDLDVVLGRPSRDAVVARIRSTAALEACVEWRRDDAKAWTRTAVRALAPDEPVDVRLDGLAPDAGYVARVLSRRAPAAELSPGDELAFRTQRAPGATFSFAVQSDSHLDNGTDLARYERTLRNVAESRADFLVDVGDTFMTDKYRDDFRASLAQYHAQRWWLGLARVPVFLVLGNHDGEVGWRDRGGADDMPHWSLAQRKRLFANPEPDGFYTGNEARDPVGGLLQNWYAWTWGDALFVALDPFWSTRDRRGRGDDPWAWTLGEAQYRWLEKTLAASSARFRFVFVHHLVGGRGAEARGGAEVAGLYEWGGRSADGTDGFAARRPGWKAPVHALLARAGPAVVFHGHDHFYAHQEHEGVVYQMVPQPGHPGGDVTKMAAEYGYVSGAFLPSPGHLRVRVARDVATVEYVRSSPRDAAENGKVVRAYEVKAR